MAIRFGGYRVIPLFPALRPYLDAAWDQTAEGDEYIIPEEYRRRAQGPGGWANANLRTLLEKIVTDADFEKATGMAQASSGNAAQNAAQSERVGSRHEALPAGAAQQKTPVLQDFATCGDSQQNRGVEAGGHQ